MTGHATRVIVDAHAVDTLAAEVGTDRIGMVLAAFCDELERRKPMLEAALASRDVAALTRETHSIKGSALAFGALALGSAASFANDHGRAGAEADTLTGAREVLRLIPETLGAVMQLEVVRNEVALS
jgi:HPt (histidine-containing phosphotransfer) domain-containing protein